MLSQIPLSKLNFSYPKHTLKIDNILIPISINMGDIYPEYSEELEIGLVGKEDDLSFEYEKLKIINRFKEYLVYINVDDKLFNNFSKNFLEYYGLNNINDLLNILSEYNLIKIIEHINKIFPIMITIFRKRLYELLKLDIDEPRISYKEENKMPENIQEYLKYTELYILCQSVIEYNPTPLFEENIGKPINQWSVREYELHMAYLTIKNKFENVQNKWHMKQMQDSKPK